MNFIVKKTILCLIILTLFACNKNEPVKVNLEPINPHSLNNESNLINQETETFVETPLMIIEKDLSKIETILQENNQLPQANNWQFKAIFIKVNEDTNPPELNYYYHQSIYEDSNNNQIQDQADQGFFNPASTVKVAISAVVLEKLNQLNLGLQTQYRIKGKSQWYSIQEDIKKALIISDNEATNRLILFLGFNYLQARMKELGFNYYSVNRLMLDQGTLINSPAFELKFQENIIQQEAQITNQSSNCYEIGEKTGNCATADDLIEILIRLIQPEFFPPEKRFNLRENERNFILEMMSKTPQAVGFNQENTFCRFLDPLGKKIANHTGKLLSKCGIGLFTHSFIDSSFIETDQGEKYYLIMAINPPDQISKTQSINWFNLIAELILNNL